ncbi:MAG: sulfite exporter TauE/SafE family protein [Pseudomonadota bacterium]
MADIDPTASILAIVFAVFFVAGAAKGTVGLGLPAITIALLAGPVGFRTAIALVLIPAILTNFWQGLGGGQLRTVVVRLWPFLLAGFITLVLTAIFALSVSGTLLAMCLGVILIVNSGAGLLGYHLPPPGPRWETPISGTVGGFNGVVAGLTGVYSVPSALYFPVLELNRDVFVQAVGLWFLICSCVLLVTFGLSATMTLTTLMVSLACVVPTFAGMFIGQRFRNRLNEKRFRQVVQAALFLLGIYLVARAVFPIAG